MNTGPYSNEQVQQYLQEEFIPVKSQCYWDNRTELMKQFRVAWTPTLLVLDQSGQEHRRMIGFLPVDDFLAQLKLGKGMIQFNRFRFEEAKRKFSEVIEQHPQAGVVPEAFFFVGVAEYWSSHEPKYLRQAYDRLKAKFPDSEWTRRAQPYGQIPQ